MAMHNVRLTLFINSIKNAAAMETRSMTKNALFYGTVSLQVDALRMESDAVVSTESIGPSVAYPHRAPSRGPRGRQRGRRVGGGREKERDPFGGSRFGVLSARLVVAPRSRERVECRAPPLGVSHHIHPDQPPHIAVSPLLPRKIIQALRAGLSAPERSSRTEKRR